MRFTLKTIDDELRRLGTMFTSRKATDTFIFGKERRMTGWTGL
jgi:hypothetical protein